MIRPITSAKVNTRVIVGLPQLGEKGARTMVKETSLYAETRIGVNAYKYVYSRPASKSYVRTGNLLGGRGTSFSQGAPYRVDKSATHVELIADPRYKGASTNYAPFVNARKKPAPAPFFDQAVQDTKNQIPTIANRVKSTLTL